MTQQTPTIAINGFGRIGRCIARALSNMPNPPVKLIAINDLAPPAHLAHLLRFDSVHGRFDKQVTVTDTTMTIGEQKIALSQTRRPEDLNWNGVDIVLECSGRFTTRETAAAHLQNGSKRVLVSAPVKSADKTIVFGVNHTSLQPDDLIVSNASCTTNCLAPVAMVLDAHFGIVSGYMTTVHAYTGDQPTHDRNHSDLYRARAAALSMIPTSTGAARAISLVLPQLEGRIEGSALRVPTANVSMIDLSFNVEKVPSVAELNAAMQAAALGELAGVLGYETAPLVSVDFNHTATSSNFAAPQTCVTAGGLCRVVSWYDNEWGFSNRMIDMAGLMAGQLGSEKGKS